MMPNFVVVKDAVGNTGSSAAAAALMAKRRAAALAILRARQRRIDAGTCIKVVPIMAILNLIAPFLYLGSSSHSHHSADDRGSLMSQVPTYMTLSYKLVLIK